MKRTLRSVPSSGGEEVSTGQAYAMTVRDVMTRPVVVIHSRAGLREMANLLRRHRISGLPVVDDDQHLVGMVSESDLLRRLVRAEMLRLFAGQGPAPVSGCQSRATAHTAVGLVSQPPVSTTPGTSVDEALELMRRRAVRRLPVIDEEGRVVGMVTRTDLLQPYVGTDQELFDQLRGEVLPGLGVDPDRIRVDVEEGSVLLGGTLADSQLVARVEEAVRDTPGVVFVESRLRALRPTPPQQVH